MGPGRVRVDARPTRRRSSRAAWLTAADRSTGATTGARDPAGGLRHLRAARQGLHEAAPRRPERAARHLRRPRPSGGDRALQRPRRHRRRAAARPPVRPRRRRSPRAGCATTGATSRSASSPPTTSTLAATDDQVDEFKAMVKALHAAGHRGHPRRRLQPHRRGRRGRPDAVPSAGSTTPPTTGSTTDGAYVDDTGCGNTLDAHRAAGAAAGDGRAALLARRRCTSTGSASTSPPRSAAAPTASTPTARSSRPSARIPCSPGSS